MRVLLITVRSDFGGGPRHVNQLIEHLSSDIELFVAYPENGDPYAQMWKNNSRIAGSIFIPYRRLSVATLFKLRRFVQENSIDIIHSHGNGAGVYSRLMRLLGVKAKIIHTFHGVTDNYTSKLKKIFMKISGKFFSLCTDKFVLVSKGEFALAKKMGFLKEEKSIVIYNGIEPLGDRILSDRFNIVTLSRFDYQKNMDYAYEIAVALKDEDIYFTWVGDGPDFERLKQRAESEKLKVLFTGFSNTPVDYLKNASIYLSTSRFEGLPYALIEASSVGLPIVATNVVGNNETLEDGVSGFLFDSKESAIDKILSLKKNRQMLEKMSAQAKMFFERNFAQAKMLDKIESLYKKHC